MLRDFLFQSRRKLKCKSIRKITASATCLPPKTIILGEVVEDEGGRVTHSGKAFQTRPGFVKMREKREAREWTF